MSTKFFKVVAFVLALSGVSYAAGTWCTNNYGYKSQLTTQGTTDYAQFNISMDRIDAALAAGGILIGGPTYATLDAALAAGATGNIVIPASTQTLSSSIDRTALAGAQLIFAKGAVVTIPVGRTLTINGTLDAGLYQIFSCTGTGKVVFGAGAVKEVYPEWWAINTTPGATDMTAGIQAAHNASVSDNSGPFAPVGFTGTKYLFTTLTWSPHVRAIAHGKVYLETANASGRTIQISDQYGRPTTYGLNSSRNTVFDGQFYLKNTNAANTAIAWSFGGATTDYYCCFCTPLNGVETRSFTGGVYELRNNAFLLDISHADAHYNTGNIFIISGPLTNSGEGIRFIECVFGGGSYVIDVNFTDALSVDFIGCSADYMLGLNKPGNTAPLSAFNWIGGHLEWNTVAAAYLQNDSTATWNIDGAYIITTAVSGWFTYAVSVTTGAGTTNFINCKYAMPPGIYYWHDLASATSKGVFDYSPNYQGGSAPQVGFLHYGASGIDVGRAGIRCEEGGYIPVWSGTLGNGTLVGYFSRIGKKVSVSIRVVWGSTTSHDGNGQTFALPFAASATYPSVGSWWANDYGTGANNGVCKVSINGTTLTLWDGATKVQATGTAPITWAEHDDINISLSYFVD